MPSAKYKPVPNEVEKNTIGSEVNRERFNFARWKKLKEKRVDLRNLTRKFTREKS